MPAKKERKPRPRKRRRNHQLAPAPILDEPALADFLRTNGIKERHAIKIITHLLRTPGATIAGLDDVASLPKGIGTLLAPHFALFTTRVVKAQTSSDGCVTKLLVALQDGLQVETVVIRHGASTARRVAGEARTTLCVSSQVGCKMGCAFCATGTMGELGNLASGEILEQLVHAHVRAGADVRNVVFMGMGEPLNNYAAVTAAVRAMVDPRRFQLAPSRVTVSTVGIVPNIYKLVEDLPKVNLALSLHAPTQALRESFVPAAKGFKLPKLMARFSFSLSRCPFFAHARLLLLLSALINEN